MLERSLTLVVTEEHVYGPFPLWMSIPKTCSLTRTTTSLVFFGVVHSLCLMPIERFAVIPEFIYPSVAPAETKQAIAGLRGVFLDALEKVERERGGLLSGIPLHHFFASPRCLRSFVDALQLPMESDDCCAAYSSSAL